MTPRRVCACRRTLTESELFAAHGMGSAPIAAHDAAPCVPQRIPLPEPPSSIVRFPTPGQLLRSELRKVPA